MRITENRLRDTIRRIISEMSDIMPQTGMSPFMQKALACCDMPAAMLFDMCAQICAQNADKKSHCAELCACIFGSKTIGRGEIDRCCECLKKICECGICAEICFKCCGC